MHVGIQVGEHVKMYVIGYLVELYASLLLTWTGVALGLHPGSAAFLAFIFPQRLFSLFGPHLDADFSFFAAFLAGRAAFFSFCFSLNAFFAAFAPSLGLRFFLLDFCSWTPRLQ